MHRAHLWRVGTGPQPLYCVPRRPQALGKGQGQRWVLSPPRASASLETPAPGLSLPALIQKVQPGASEMPPILKAPALSETAFKHFSCFGETLTEMEDRAESASQNRERNWGLHEEQGIRRHTHENPISAPYHRRTRSGQRAGAGVLTCVMVTCSLPNFYPPPPRPPSLLPQDGHVQPV